MIELSRSSSTIENSNRTLTYAVAILLLVISVTSIIFENYNLGIFVFLIPFLFFALLFFESNIKYYFVTSLFFANYFYWPLRIQMSLLFGILMILIFLTNSQNSIFNNLKLPKAAKYLGSTLVLYIFVSSFLSPHFSISAFYYSLLFCIFISTSYVVYRLITSTDDINKIMQYFTILTVISGIIIIIRIVMTGKIRSLGIAGFAIMDYIVISLVILIFRDFLLGKQNKKSILYLTVIFIIFITTQSRFAWLGFLLTMIYGSIISGFYSQNAKELLRKKVPQIIIIFVILISLLFVTGLGSVFIGRLTEINFSFFQNEEGLMVTNSMESRILIWIVALNTFLSHPVTGIGYLMFSEVSEQYNVLPLLAYQIFVENLDAHTTYFNILCETGIIGFVFFLSYIITVFTISIKAIKISLSNSKKNTSIILNLLVFFFMVHSIYSGAYTFGQGAFVMHFIFGITLANYSLLKIEYRSRSEVS